MLEAMHMQPIDDEFHFRGRTSEWWEVETLWFAFDVPERGLDGIVYLVTRVGMGHTTLFVNIFDQSGHEPWRMRYARSLWGLPIPESLRTFEMPEVGLRFETLKPMKSYKIDYAHANLKLDLTFDGLNEPILFPGKYGGVHIDQCVRAHGTIELDGETIPVDCFQMRDRSWGSMRSDLEDREGGYTYAVASADSAFNIISSREPGGHYQMRTGFLIRDGKVGRLKSGTREVLERGEHGQPVRVLVTGVDEFERSFIAESETVSFAILQVPGNILGIACLSRWQFDGQECFGEEQEATNTIAYSRILRDAC